MSMFSQRLSSSRANQKNTGPCSRCNSDVLKHLKKVKLPGCVILTQIINAACHIVTIKANNGFRMPRSVFGHGLISVMISLRILGNCF